MKTKRDRLTSDKPEEMNNCRVAELCEKLKKYEEICIYPEKLKEISGLFLEKCQEVNRLKADLETQNDRWIPCSERLPEVPKGIDDDECPEFNVVIKGASKATTLRCSSDGQWFDEFGNVYPVFFWQPLPEVNRLKADLEKQKNRSSRKQTNADRIREMSDEELIKIIMCPYDISGIPVNMMPCVRNGNIQELIPPEECNKCMMEWLQSEVEE